MNNTQSARLYVQEGLDRRREERNEQLRIQAQQEEERREEMLEALFLEHISAQTRLNRMRSEHREAAAPMQKQCRRSMDAQRRRRKAEEEAEMRTSQRRAKIGYSTIGHVIIILVLAMALKDEMVAQELVTPFSCCVSLVFGFDAGRICNELIVGLTQPRKAGRP